MIDITLSNVNAAKNKSEWSTRAIPKWSFRCKKLMYIVEMYLYIVNNLTRIRVNLIFVFFNENNMNVFIFVALQCNWNFLNDNEVYIWTSQYLLYFNNRFREIMFCIIAIVNKIFMQFLLNPENSNYVVTLVLSGVFITLKLKIITLETFLCIKVM